MDAVKNILFPTDFSLNAQKALPYAVDMIKRTKGMLYLLHVYDMPLTGSADYAQTPAKGTASDIAEDIRQIALDKMERSLKAYELPLFQYQRLVSEGGTMEEILKAVEREDIDLIVMGTRGAKAKRDVFMGSTAKNVIQLAVCPVVAIPEAADFKPISKIVYATNLENDESHLLRYVLEIARLYRATVAVLHINQEDRSPGNDMTGLKDIARNVNYPEVTFTAINETDIVAGINKYVAEEKADVLAMTSYTTTFFDRIVRKSYTEQMLFQTHIPLLAFVRKKYDTIFLG